MHGRSAGSVDNRTEQAYALAAYAFAGNVMRSSVYTLSVCRYRLGQADCALDLYLKHRIRKTKARARSSQQYAALTADQKALKLEKQRARRTAKRKEVVDSLRALTADELATQREEISRTRNEAARAWRAKHGNDLITPSDPACPWIRFQKGNVPGNKADFSPLWKPCYIVHSLPKVSNAPNDGPAFKCC